MKRAARVKKRGRAPIATWLTEPMSRDVRAAIERVARLDGVARIAVMPDVHLAVGGCVGMVVATSRRILPQAVGGDIGCGMLAIATDVGADALACPDRSGALLNRLRTAVPAMRHRDLASAPALDGLQPSLLSTASLAKRAEREGRIELGSLGRGNHFLEFQRDEEGRLWLMIHSGSRCMGQAISGAHDANAERAAGGLRCLDAATPAGQAYLNDVAWARAYAAENRRLIANAAGAVLNELIGAALLPETRIECDHNHVRIEAHFGRELLLHRKGAAPAAEGEPGVIPGSMGTESFHTIGRGCADALRSSSHGAGRALTRTEARRRVSPERLERQLGDVAFDTRLADRLCEEAPSAYKDIGGVMRAQRELTRISRRLRPVLVYKGV